MSLIINGTISFGATPISLSDIIENPTAIIKHPPNTNNIFTNIFADSIGKYDTAFTPYSIIGPTPITHINVPIFIRFLSTISIPINNTISIIIFATPGVTSALPVII